MYPVKMGGGARAPQSEASKNWGWSSAIHAPRTAYGRNLEKNLYFQGYRAYE